MDQGLSRRRRVRKNGEFLRVYQSGKRVSDGSLSLVVLSRPGKEETRLGLSVSRKVGPAVVRNRVKRRLREIFRLTRPRFKPGMDMVVVAKPPASNLKFGPLQESFLALCRKASLFLNA